MFPLMICTLRWMKEDSKWGRNDRRIELRNEYGVGGMDGHDVNVTGIALKTNEQFHSKKLCFHSTFSPLIE